MTINKEDIESIAKRARESYMRQILTQPEKKCGLCNWFLKYEHARTLITGLESEIMLLRRQLNRQLNNKLKPRTDTYSLQANR